MSKSISSFITVAIYYALGYGLLKFGFTFSAIIVMIMANNIQQKMDY